jgi:3-methylcrotonyl-CoA carboxylase alpha subunit
MPESAAPEPPRAIRRVLIANRGEIAVRIARTCHEMGIAVVAVFSTADERALHVLVADEAVCLGPPPALESYLNINAILDAARESGADAIHPGYGFLAENARFAEAVEAAGLIWIGPPPPVIALMGDKVAAKELARGAGLPTVPGYMGEDQRAETLLAAAGDVGYPILLKAAAGGGGRGMRAVTREEDLVPALEGAKREAQSAFGDDRIFLERMLVQPRHVEVQVLLDSHGHGVYLGDRDCSIQRRHQKVIEEAPAPGLSLDLHAAMGSDAVRLAQAAGYVNAGTVEFLLDGEQYYFLEMNTRIQVEHPVTEMVTDLDLVRLQIEIAAGAELQFGQDDVTIDGHALEARIYAEDPAHGFLPSTGTITAFDPHDDWEDVRNDVGVYRGFEVTPYYDPMLAKLVVWAPDRTGAVDALRYALAAYEIAGPTTNLSFLQWAASSEAFSAGTMDIAFVDREWQSDLAAELPLEVLAAAAASDLFRDDPNEEPQPGRTNPWSWNDGWRQRGVARRLVYRYGGRTHTVDAESAGDQVWRLRSGDREIVAERFPEDARTVWLRGAGGLQRTVPVLLDGGLQITWEDRTYLLRRGPERDLSGAGGKIAAEGGPTTPMPGTVVKVAVEAGQHVRAHEPLVVLEAMKMEHVVEAPQDGVVTEVLVREGDMVPAGSLVVTLETP